MSNINDLVEEALNDYAPPVGGQLRMPQAYTPSGSSIMPSAYSSMRDSFNNDGPRMARPYTPMGTNAMAAPYTPMGAAAMPTSYSVIPPARPDIASPSQDFQRPRPLLNVPRY